MSKQKNKKGESRGSFRTGAIFGVALSIFVYGSIELLDRRCRGGQGPSCEPAKDLIGRWVEGWLGGSIGFDVLLTVFVIASLIVASQIFFRRRINADADRDEDH